MNENRLTCKLTLLQPRVEYLRNKIIVKLLENVLYLTAIGTGNHVNIVLEECRSHEWQNNGLFVGKNGLAHFIDTAAEKVS